MTAWACSPALDEAGAEPLAAARSRDHQRALELKPRRLFADPRKRARREHDALRGDLVGKGSGHEERE
jgi:hypothetical protein